MAYTPPTDEQDPWYDDITATFEYLRTTAEGAATTAGAAAVKGNNLSDLTDAPTARNNLSLGTAATHAHGDYDAAGAATAAQAAAVQRANHTGTQSADTLTDGTTNKAFLATERTKLSGIATSATANDTDANLKARANHTGTQTAATISDFSTAADARVAAAVGTTVQGQDAELQAVAGLTSAADRLPYFTGSGTASLATFTAAGRAIVDDADAAAQRTTLALGNVDNTSDATKNSATSTLTNKRVTPRVDSTAATATYTFNWDNFDAAKITAQNAALNVANPTGTPTAMQRFILRVKDNGTARAITYGTQFRAIGVTLPTTTVISKTVYLGCIWNSEDTKVDVLAVGQEA